MGVLWPNGMGTQLPPPKNGTAPQYLAHVCCGQMAGWIKMPLDTEVGLSPGDIVLDGDPAPPKKAHSTPHFSPMSLLVKRLDGSRCRSYITTKKTKEMLLGSISKDPPPLITINSSPVQRVQSFKSLGVLLTSSLSWIEHLNILLLCALKPANGCIS